MAKRILVVDDDRSVREVLRELLDIAGYQVASAEDGEEALEKIRAEPFDLVLLDVWMPKKDGLEVLAELRALAPRPGSGQAPAPRVVVLTADDAPRTVLQAVRDQAYQYVSKPFDTKALLDVIARVLAAPSEPPIEVVSARPTWVELLVPCAPNAAQRVQDFLQKLKGDLPEEVRYAVGQAFGELLANAIEWGGELDPNRRVRIAFLRAKRMLIYRIADPGKGFRFEELVHAAVANPPGHPIDHLKVREEKGIRPGGFGILMSRALVDELIYNEAANEVVFIKYLD